MFHRLVPPEVETSFITIIDSILAASDLDTISEKRIRKGLQESVQYDITPQKVRHSSHVIVRSILICSQSAIKTLIMARFDKFDAQRKAAVKTNGATSTKEQSPATPASGAHISPPARKRVKRESAGKETPRSKPTPSPKKHVQESDDDDLSDVKDSPPKKKKRIDHDSDAAYAAKLQAQENSRIRSTRGGGPKATPAKKKKTPKKKTSAKVRAEDDSDIEGSGSETKERKVNRTGGFHVRRHTHQFICLLTSIQKELNLSPALSALLDNEVKVQKYLLQAMNSILTIFNSFRVLRLSSGYGPTFARMTYKIQVTSA